jgi:hypothetical protein
MAFVVTNDGDNQMILAVLNKVTPELLTLKLFANNVTPDKSYTTASFTECSGNGYASIGLTAANWTVTEGTGAGTTPTTAAQPQQTFTLTGALTAYGYYLVGATSGKCYLAELFSGAPWVIPSGGGTIKITPTITNFS